MALINCSECGGNVSDRAKACPHCGAPVEISVVAQPVTPQPAPQVVPQPVAPQPIVSQSAPQIVPQSVAPQVAPQPVVSQPVVTPPAPQVVTQSVTPSPAPAPQIVPQSVAPQVVPQPVRPQVVQQPVTPAPQPVPHVVTEPAPTAKPRICPESHMTKSIIITLFCCVPFGALAILNASKVTEKFLAGDYVGALESSEKAEKWCTWALVSGILWAVLYTAFLIVMIATGNM